MTKINTAEMIRTNAVRFAKAEIKPEWKSVAQATAVRLCRADNKAWFVAESKRLNGTPPWWAIAIIKEREAGSDPQFTRSIAQGDRWDRVSINVPRGRGPFPDWYKAADDALTLCDPHPAYWTDWSAGGAMTIFIRFNGLGYDGMGKPSPYAYSGTDQYVIGKYNVDGHYDPELVDKQLGCATMLKAMMAIDKTIVLAAEGASPPRGGPPPDHVVKEKTKNASAARKVGAGGAAGGVAGTVAQDKPTSVSAHGVLYGVVAFGLVLTIAMTVVIAYQKRKLIEGWF